MSRQPSVSPVRSRSGTPLALKSDNVKRLRSVSPLKPQRLESERCARDEIENRIHLKQERERAADATPQKSPLRNTSQSPFTSTQMRNSPKFAIYQDSPGYRAEVRSHITPYAKPQLSRNSQVSSPEDKENVMAYAKSDALSEARQAQRKRQPRIPLVDLDIKSHPGFIRTASSAARNDHVLEPRFQLTEVYKPEQVKFYNIPPFVTPPRRRLNNVKFVSKSLVKKNLTSTLQKCNSFDERLAKPFVRSDDIPPTKFQIYNDI